jgi:phosphopantetheinyl transferase
MKSFQATFFRGAWFRFSGDRMALRREIEAHLREALSDPSGELHIGEDGPRWAGKVAIELSYSHTTGAAILVFSDSGPIGVDLERLDRTPVESPLAIARRYFHPDEIRELEKKETPPEVLRTRFLELWVKKEAHGKLHRTGLSGSIHTAIDSVTDARFHALPVIPEGYLGVVARFQHVFRPSS